MHPDVAGRTCAWRGTWGDFPWFLGERCQVACHMHGGSPAIGKLDLLRGAATYHCGRGPLVKRLVPCFYDDCCGLPLQGKGTMDRDLDTYTSLLSGFLPEFQDIGLRSASPNQTNIGRGEPPASRISKTRVALREPVAGPCLIDVLLLCCHDHASERSMSRNPTVFFIRCNDAVPVRRSSRLRTHGAAGIEKQ